MLSWGMNNAVRNVSANQFIIFEIYHITFKNIYQRLLNGMNQVIKLSVYGTTCTNSKLAILAYNISSTNFAQSLGCYWLVLGI